MTRTNSPDATGGKTPASVESLNARRHSPDSPGAPSRRQIRAEDLEPIVRRAAEIQNKRGNPGAQSLTEQEVIEIGRQVGLEPEHIRRAMAEVRAESLSPKLPPGNRILDLLAGDSRVEVRRVVAGDSALVQQQIEMQLRDKEKLSPLRRRTTRSVWEASGGVMDQIERFMNFSGKEYALAEARQVHLAVAEIEPGWSMVTIAADVANKRDEALYTAGSCVAVAAILAAVFTGEEVGYAIMATTGTALLVGLISAAVGIPWARWTLDKRRERVELMLEGLLDKVDR